MKVKTTETPPRKQNKDVEENSENKENPDVTHTEEQEST